MKKITYKSCVELANSSDINIERNGKSIDIWRKDDHSVVTTCKSVAEAWEELLSMNGYINPFYNKIQFKDKPIPRQYSFVEFDFESIPKEEHDNYKHLQKELFIFLGEIPNTSGYCVVINVRTNHLSPYNKTSLFKEVEESKLKKA